METNPLTQQDRLARQPVDDDEIDLLALWRMIWRRKWSIFVLTAVVVMLTILVVFNMTPVYKSVATLLIEQKSVKPVSIEDIYGVEGSSNEYLQTQFELLKSRKLAERVVENLGLTSHPEFDPRQQDEEPLIDIGGWLRSFDFLQSPEDLEEGPPSEEEVFDRAVKKLMASTTISPVPRTQLVKIEVMLEDPRMAARAANALADAYIEDQLQSRLDMTERATSWMNERLATLKQKLDESERQLQEFREQENLVDVEGVTTLTAGELSRVGDRLVEARRRRAEVESQYQQIAEMEGEGWERIASVPAVQGDPLIEEFKSEVARARSEVEELSNRYGPKHPKMISARSDLRSARANLETQVEQVVASIEREYQLAKANERSLSESFEANRDEIQQISRKEFRLRELQREVDTNRQLYDTFMTRLKETTATQDFQNVNARVSDQAVVPDYPVKPRKSLIVGLAGILAMFAGAGLAFLLEMLSNTFRGTEDVEGKLNLPVLGILPLVKGKERQDLIREFSKESNKGFAESIRTIRTSVVLSALDNPHKVILATSSVPGEGKTTLAANLAMALGQMEKVLLIDADLRRPSLLKSFGLPVGTPGLANMVAGTYKLEECVHSVDHGIDVMPSGPVPPNPQELLSAAGFAEGLRKLEEQYDRIVIDSPPSLAVSDSIVLSTMAHAVVYVIKADSTPIPNAQRGVGQLLQNNAPLLGVVLNQVDIKKATKYGYDYGGYYDYYGYSSSET